MRAMKIIRLSLLILWFAPLVHGQEPISAGVAPLQEGGVGFSYVQVNVPSEGQLAIKADFGYSRTLDAFHTGHSADLMTYMVGPVFYAVRRRKMNVYGELLLG